MLITISVRERSSGGRHGSPRRTSRSSTYTSSLGLPQIVSIGLYCLAFLSLTVNCQGASSDPRSTICLFDNHRTIVVGSTLFVDGGEWASRADFSQNRTARTLRKWQNEYLWKLDLTEPFSAREPPWELEEKPSGPDEHYNGAEGTIWNVGMGTFVTVGGWFPVRHGPLGDLYGLPYFDADKNFKLPEARIFTYDVDSNTWTSRELDKGVRRISTASWASSERLRRGYVLGGVFITEKESGPRSADPWPIMKDDWLDTMTQYDFITGEWKTEDIPQEIGMTVDGGLITLDRVGTNGTLVFLGGEERLNNGTSSISGDDIYRRRKMDLIWLYDIASAEWYSQNTTGEIPIGRRQSCFFMVPAPDLSSFQIYTFSGTLADEVTLLDLYVLTIPGFIWKKVPLTDYPDNYPINAHQCSPHAQGRQMLIVPGNINASTTTTDFTYLCNNGTGIRIFDTLDWKFRSDFDPSRTQIGVPDPIVKLIGGTSSGKAKVTKPINGWDNEALGSIFSIRNEPIFYNDPDSNKNNTNTLPPPTSANETEKTQLSGAAIAGIAVGIVIAILGFGGAAFCGSCRGFFRKRPKDKESHPVELTAQRDPVEAQAVVPGELPTRMSQRHELGANYLPAELMEARDGKFQYPPKPDEYMHDHYAKAYRESSLSDSTDRGVDGDGDVRELLPTPRPGEYINHYQQQSPYSSQASMQSPYSTITHESPYPDDIDHDRGWGQLQGHTQQIQYPHYHR